MCCPGSSGGDDDWHGFAYGFLCFIWKRIIYGKLRKGGGQFTLKERNFLNNIRVHSKIKQIQHFRSLV